MNTRLVNDDGTGPSVTPKAESRSSDFEAGFSEGYAVGYADGRKAACRPAGSSESGIKANPSKYAERGSRLLGLPCPICNTYLFSDETHCPRCDVLKE
jgi:hypothetical protein